MTGPNAQGGCVLVDAQIIAAVEDGRLAIVDPGDRPIIEKSGKIAGDAKLDTHGYVLRARKVYSWRASEKERGEDGWIDLKGAQSYTLRPGEFIIVETYEKFSFALDICGTIHALARLTLQGLSHISTTVHPGWGSKKPQPLRIAVKNVGHTKITLNDKAPIARLLFLQCGKKAAIVQPPSAEEVFARLERAIKEQRRGEAYNRKIIYGVQFAMLFMVFVVLFPIITQQATIMDWIKAVGVTMIAIYLNYIARQAGL